jgi:hypothetical protein
VLLGFVSDYIATTFGGPSEIPTNWPLEALAGGWAALEWGGTGDGNGGQGTAMVFQVLLCPSNTTL